jgi:hypothetical protein
MALSGCSYQLASLVSTEDGGPQVTGTINPSANTSAGAPSKSSSQVSPQAELDLAYARAAAAQALSRGSADAEAGMACRDFLASYIHGASQDWLEGPACRTTRGTWEVRRLKPLKSS